MGSRGDAYDHAVAETFFATLKKELVNRHSWPSRLELQSAVFEYIEAFHNTSAATPPSGVGPILSHEVIEALIDPTGSRMTHGVLTVICDPVEQPGYLIDGITVLTS